MDFNQQVEARDGSRRCHSRLSDALDYATSHPELVASSERKPLRAASVDSSPRSEPERAASGESSSGRTDSDHPPRRTASDFDTVSRSDNKRTNSETAKIQISTSYRLDKISGMGSALTSPEPILFNMAYRVKDSPFPFTVSPLPPIRGSQHDQELLDKNKKKFEYFEIGMETRDVKPKTWEKKENIQPEKERKLQQQQLDSNRKKKKFEYFEIGLEESDVEPKTWKKKESKKFEYFEIGMERDAKPLEEETTFHDDVKRQEGDIDKNQEKDLEVQEKKQNDEKTGPVDRIHKFVQKEASKDHETCSQDTEDVTQTLTKVKKILNDLLRMRKTDIQVHPPRHPKPPNSSKGQIIVRGTKASRLRQNILRIGQNDVTQDVLPQVTAPNKIPKRATLAQSNVRKSISAPPPSANKNPVPPPVLVVRETKASKLRRLKQMEDEREATRQNDEEKLKNVAFGHPLKPVLQRKRTPTFQPAPPKHYKRPEPVIIQETKASKLRQIQQNIKKKGNTVSQKQTPPMTRSETPMAPHLLPPISKNRTNGSTGDGNRDRSARNRLCRMEVSRGLKVRKDIRLAMDEEGKKWESEFKSKIKIPEETYRVQRSVDSNKQMVQKELDLLRERLRQAEVVETDSLNSKDKAFFSSKYKTYFKKATEDEKNLKERMKKERKEAMDEYFKRTEEKFSKQLSYDWATFLLQQHCHHEMLKKARLQEEMIYQWKSQAIHYRVLHTMLEKDIEEGRRDSWYL